MSFHSKADGKQLHRCFRFWFMKEDDEAISSLKLQMKTLGDFSFVSDIWTITESRIQEWRSAQAAINSYGYDFMVCSS